MSEVIIKKGDTYTSLAKDYNTTAKAIQNSNPGVNPRKLQIGQKITIPIVKQSKLDFTLFGNKLSYLIFSLPGSFNIFCINANNLSSSVFE